LSQDNEKFARDSLDAAEKRVSTLVVFSFLFVILFVFFLLYYAGKGRHDLAILFTILTIVVLLSILFGIREQYRLRAEKAKMGW
jgi:hypothetical protein